MEESGGEDDALEALFMQCKQQADAESARAQVQQTSKRRLPAAPQPLPTTNKGFQLLKALGYQEGQGLGAREQGRAEPIAVQVRQARSGLGVEEAKRERERQAKRHEDEQRVKRARTEAQTAVAYTHSARSVFQARKLTGQIKDAWRACETLDLQATQRLGTSSAGDPQHPSDAPALGPQDSPEGATATAMASSSGEVSGLRTLLDDHPPLTQLLVALGALPDLTLTQPSMPQQAGPDTAEAPLAHGAPQQGTDDEDELRCGTHACGGASHATMPTLPHGNRLAQRGRQRADAPLQQAAGSAGVVGSVTAVDLQDAQALQAQLTVLLEHLRGEHWYCFFCGCGYDSAEDLQENCPGTQEDDH